MTGFVVASLLAAAPLLAQDVTPVRVPDEVSCGTCRIVLTTVATLGDASGPGELANAPTGIRMDGRERYWLWEHNDGGPRVFDRTGRFLRKNGRRGQGPGEFEILADVLIIPGDSVFVIDAARRATMFGPDLEPVRHQRTEQTLQYSAVLDWPRTVIGFSHYASGRRGGPVFHVMMFDSVTSRVMHSFGPEWGGPDPGAIQSTLRAIAPSRTGIWAAPHESYRVEHWTADGSNTLVLERTPAWPPRATGEVGNVQTGTPPPNSLQAIREDEEGRLWTFIKVAAPNWRDGLPRDARETRASAYEPDALFRTLIEVIDPRTHRVVARRQLNEWVAYTLPGNRAAIYFVGRDDVPRLRIVQLTLEGAR